MSLTQSLLRSPTVAALTSPHGVDRYLELVNPMWAAHEVRARIVHVQRETLDVSTLTLQPTNTWNGFRAGQHVQVGVEIDKVRHTRCFSISSSDLADKLAGDATFTVTVRGHDDGLVSPHLARHADVGTVVHLSQAEGAFVLPPLLPRKLLMISGGSGITPVMAMLRSLVDFRYEGRITFVHYARSPEETSSRSVIRTSTSPSYTPAPGRSGSTSCSSGACAPPSWTPRRTRADLRGWSRRCAVCTASATRCTWSTSRRPRSTAGR